MSFERAMWAAAVKNMVCMICWTVLAIHFGTWWIAMFSCLTMTEVKWKSNEEEK